MNGFQWRPYQNECFQSIIGSYQKGINKQLIVQATGLGKRIQAVYLARLAKKQLFLAHTEELIDQAYRDFVKMYGEFNVGIIRGKYNELDKRFVISSPQTLINRIKDIHPDTFTMLQADEVHRYRAKTFYDVVNHFNVNLRTGWTATPRRFDGLSLMDLFDEKVFEYGIIDGIREGYLAELDGIQIRTNVNLDSVKKIGGDFNIGQLQNVVDVPQRNKLIVDSYLKYAAGRPFIAFCVDTLHMIHLAEHFADRGIKVGLISSDKSICPDRKGTMKAFANKELQGLINVNILTEGYDYSDVGAILWATPTMSESKFLQGIGRGTRLKSEWFKITFGAADCKVLDFVDITSKHSLVNTFELDRHSSAIDKIFVNTEKREKILEAEKARRESKVMGDVDKDKFIDLMKLPKIHISQSVKMMDEATPAQIKMLQTFGLYDTHDEDGNPILYTKKMVSEIIATSPTTPYMQHKLVSWGYNPSGSTIAQFLDISKKIKREAEEKAQQEKIERDNEELANRLARVIRG